MTNPGWKTSELKVVIGFVLYVAVSSFLSQDEVEQIRPVIEQLAERAIELFAIALVAYKFIDSRTEIKKTEIENGE